MKKCIDAKKNEPDSAQEAKPVQFAELFTIEKHSSFFSTANLTVILGVA
jgi:hypothetical protein